MNIVDDFQSISKGVFIIPYQERSDDSITDENGAGPSRPLKRWYDKTYEACRAAQEKHENERTDEQLEDIADWLERCGSKSASGGLTFGLDIHRIPVGIIQDPSPRLTGLLDEVVKHKAVLTGREVVDISAGTRGIMLGIIDETVGGAKSGRSSMDEVERWYTSLPTARRSPLLVLIHDAQVIPPAILSELIYVLSLRPSLPIRVLLSVPSTSTFLGAFSHVEPSGVEVDVLGLGSKAGRGGAVGAILEAGSKDPDCTPIYLGEDLVREMEEDEKLYGSGAASALKSLKWRLLHHSVNSPLSTLVDRDEDMLSKVEAVFSGPGDERGPLHDLLEIGPHREAQATLNPTPRVSVLQALSTSAGYTHRLKSNRKGQDRPSRDDTSDEDEDTATPRPTKRRRANRGNEPTPPIAPETYSPAPILDLAGGEGDFKELQVLFTLWRSAGRNVNLWDWLEGFRGSMMGPERAIQPDEEGTEEQTRDQGTPAVADGNRDAGQEEEEEQETTRTTSTEKGDAIAAEAAEEEQAAELHAIFVRFCEEARMMGLVRARGRAKRADEVVKSIEFV